MEILGTLKAVENTSQLSTDKFYALAIGDDGMKELGRFVGASEKGSAFVILNNIVRQDRAVQNITIRDRALPHLVFELGDE